MAMIVLEFGRTPSGKIGFQGLAEFSGDAGVDAVVSQVTQDVEQALLAMGIRREEQEGGSANSNTVKQEKN